MQPVIHSWLSCVTQWILEDYDRSAQNTYPNQESKWKPGKLDPGEGPSRNCVMFCILKWMLKMCSQGVPTLKTYSFFIPLLMAFFNLITNFCFVNFCSGFRRWARWSNCLPSFGNFPLAQKICCCVLVQPSQEWRRRWTDKTCCLPSYQRNQMG